MAPVAAKDPSATRPRRTYQVDLDYTTRRGQKATGAELLLMFCLLPFTTILNGWVVKTIWNWFLPSITGWPRLGTAQAIGLAAIVSVFTTRTSTSESKSQTRVDRWSDFFAAILTLFMTLGLAWIAHQVVVS